MINTLALILLKHSGIDSREIVTYLVVLQKGFNKLFRENEFQILNQILLTNVRKMKIFKYSFFLHCGIGANFCGDLEKNVEEYSDLFECQDIYRHGFKSTAVGRSTGVDALKEMQVHYATLLNYKKIKVLPRFELGLLDSKSRVIAITP